MTFARERLLAAKIQAAVRTGGSFDWNPRTTGKFIKGDRSASTGRGGTGNRSGFSGFPTWPTKRQPSPCPARFARISPTTWSRRCGASRESLP